MAIMLSDHFFALLAVKVSYWSEMTTQRDAFEYMTQHVSTLIRINDIRFQQIGAT